MRQPDPFDMVSEFPCVLAGSGSARAPGAPRGWGLCPRPEGQHRRPVRPCGVSGRRVRPAQRPRRCSGGGAPRILRAGAGAGGLVISGRLARAGRVVRHGSNTIEFSKRMHCFCLCRTCHVLYN